MNLAERIRQIESLHRKFDDIETPALSGEVVADALSLAEAVERHAIRRPDTLNGTVDGTVCFEWHAIGPPRGFLSIDALGGGVYELFVKFQDPWHQALWQLGLDEAVAKLRTATHGDIA